MVISPLADFGAVERKYRDEPFGNTTLPRLIAFRITPGGAALLTALHVLRD